MRAAPAFQVSVRCFGVWRTGVGLLAGAAVSAMVAWVASHERPISAAIWAGAACGVSIVVLAAMAVARQRAIELRWDGQNWQLGRGSGEPLIGVLGVALDLGGWILLRFTPTSSWMPFWLPVQRRGLEASWHALRCAVHAGQPSPENPVIGGG